MSLFKKEMKLYFSSSLYVTNTIVGYVLAVILSGAIAFLDMETLLGTMTTSGTPNPAIYSFHTTMHDQCLRLRHLHGRQNLLAATGASGEGKGCI